jgi:hypothetical protein
MTHRDPGEYAPNKTWKRKMTEAIASRGGSGSCFNLFDAPAPSVPRPTSEDAADSQGKSKRATDRIVILRTLAWQAEGMTRDEIAESTGISPNTVRPRIVELVALGLVSDGRITRLTQTGSPAAVCEVTAKGRAAL